ncbi:MAG: hypothetical protein ACPF9D_06025 [Owenweeksia sp.]
MKLLDNIKQPFSFPGELVALELSFTNTSVRYNAVHLKLVKDQVEVITYSSGTEVTETLEALDKNLPVLLFLTGRRVLVKEVKGVGPDTDEEMIMSRAFPNISLDELLYNIQFLEGKAMVSVVRQDFMAQTLEDISVTDHRIIDVAIGIYTVWPLLDQLGNRKYHLGYHEVNLDQQSVQGLAECNEEELILLGEKLPAHVVIPFIFGLSRMAARDFISAESKVRWYRRDWQFHNLYKKGIFSGMVAVFAILLISFLLFNYYHDTNQALSEDIQSYDSQIKMVEDLKASYERKDRFLQTNGLGTSSFSVMADQLAATVPKGIALEQMSFYPLEKRLKKEKLVRFHRDQLVLKGEVENYNFFQQWLDKMNAFEWTTDIQITGYQEENDRHEAHFNLKVLLQ